MIFADCVSEDNDDDDDDDDDDDEDQDDINNENSDTHNEDNEEDDNESYNEDKNKDEGNTIMPPKLKPVALQSPKKATRKETKWRNSPAPSPRSSKSPHPLRLSSPTL